MAKSLDGAILPEDPKDVLIRGQQAELAELKLQHIATLSQAAELESERMDLLKQIEFHLNQLSVLSEGNAKLKADNSHAGLRSMVQRLTDENNKLKAERRELALRIAYEVWDECDSHIAEGRQCVGEVDLVAIVEQELNRAP